MIHSVRDVRDVHVAVKLQTKLWNIWNISTFLAPKYLYYSDVLTRYFKETQPLQRGRPYIIIDRKQQL